MGPSTLMFMLRWQLVPFIFGIIMIGMSAFGLLTFQGDPPDAIFSSLAGMIGRPVIWIGLALGLYLVGSAWYKAARLRTGT